MNELKKVRESRKITQRELSERTGLAIRTISAYESGYRRIDKMELRNAFLIAKSLDCKIEDFYKL